MQVKEKKSTKNNNKAILWVIIIVLIISNAFFVWQFYNQKQQVKTIVIEQQETTGKNEELQGELDSLLSEYEAIRAEYESMSIEIGEKDSIIQANANRIQKLIASQADYHKIKKDLRLLRNMTQNYIDQLDSLYEVNYELTAENKKIKKQYELETIKTKELSKDKEELTEKVQEAAVLQAYRVTATPLRIRRGGEKQIPTDKAKKVDKIQVCFTLGKNSLVQPGVKNLYVRIVSPPNNHVLMKRASDSFVYKGEIIQYSIKHTVNYNNDAIFICLDWVQSDEYYEGNYKVDIFAEDYFLGSTRFILQ